MPRGFLLWLIVMSAIGWGVYQLKYQVQALEGQLTRINREIVAEQDSIHVLKAEWSYLNDPTRLADLARRYTDLAPVTPTQIAGFDVLQARLPDTAPFNRGAHEGGSAESAPPLLLSAKPAAPNGNAGAVAAGAAPASGAVMAASQTRKSTQPTDEQAAADGVIDAILADMKKAQSQ